MTLNSVVLPAPLGPMSPVTWPGSTSSDDVVERLEPAEADRDVGHLEQRHRSAPRRRHRRRPASRRSVSASARPGTVARRVRHRALRLRALLRELAADLGHDAVGMATDADAGEAGDRGAATRRRMSNVPRIGSVTGGAQPHERPAAGTGTRRTPRRSPPTHRRRRGGARTAGPRASGSWRSPAEPRSMPSSAPPKPAIAAEIAKTATLVENRFTPSVAHAAGLSCIATRRRPNAPRRSSDDAEAEDAEQQR